MITVDSEKQLEIIHQIEDSKFLLKNFVIGPCNSERVKITLTGTEFYFEFSVTARNISNVKTAITAAYIHPSSRKLLTNRFEWRNAVSHFKWWIDALKKEIDTLEILNEKIQSLNKVDDNPKSEYVEEYFVDFNRIFKQAQKAEEFGLTELAGMGYRKALEFLVKDYLIAKGKITQEEAQSNTQLRLMVKKLNHQELIDVAERASWLGNDFAHYYRKHAQLDLKDLRDFIGTTVEWILHLENHEELLVKTNVINNKFHA
ncbi:MAG: DUF4145 domain-containing protein [Chitinophagales bacterium]|nr:DUF4145 domain-containing protein [Chitinophagales bacterium]